MNKFEHVNATSISSAIKLLKENNNSRIIAGGTDLLPKLRLGILSPERLVNLKTISGLDQIDFKEDSGLHLGALATLGTISGNKTVCERYPILYESIISAASPQLRNRGTIAGNLNQDSRCWYYRGQFQCWLKGGQVCYAREGENARHAIFGNHHCYTVHPSDPAPALIALQAEVQIEGPEAKRRLLLEDYFQEPLENSRQMTSLGPAEILTKIFLPVPPPNSRGIYLKAMDRKVWSFALASLAVQLTLDNKTIKETRVVLGGVAPKPWRVPEVEEILKNNKLNDVAIDQAAEIIAKKAQPLSHNGYKIPLVEGLVKEALIRLKKPFSI